MFGGHVEVYTKNTLYQFIEGQTHLAPSEFAKLGDGKLISLILPHRYRQKHNTV